MPLGYVPALTDYLLSSDLCTDSLLRAGAKCGVSGPAPKPSRTVYTSRIIAASRLHTTETVQLFEILYSVPYAKTIQPPCILITTPFALLIIVYSEAPSLRPATLGDVAQRNTTPARPFTDPPPPAGPSSSPPPRGPTAARGPRPSRGSLRRRTAPPTWPSAGTTSWPCRA